MTLSSFLSMTDAERASLSLASLRSIAPAGVKGASRVALVASLLAWAADNTADTDADTDADSDTALAVAELTAALLATRSPMTGLIPSSAVSRAGNELRQAGEADKRLVERLLNDAPEINGKARATARSIVSTLGNLGAAFSGTRGSLDETATKAWATAVATYLGSPVAVLRTAAVAVRAVKGARKRSDALRMAEDSERDLILRRDKATASGATEEQVADRSERATLRARIEQGRVKVVWSAKRKKAAERAARRANNAATAAAWTAEDAVADLLA